MNADPGLLFWQIIAFLGAMTAVVMAIGFFHYVMADREERKQKQRDKRNAQLKRA